MIDIYEYLDYRKYLKDIYADHKEKHSFFSYRYITGQLGLKSTAYFTWILQGKRNLSQSLILKFISIFKLTLNMARILVYIHASLEHKSQQSHIDDVGSEYR